MLSTLDLPLGVELDEIGGRLTIDDDLSAAAFRRETPVGALVSEIADYQHVVDAGQQPSRDLDELIQAGSAAFRWATSLVNAMAGSRT